FDRRGPDRHRERVSVQSGSGYGLVARQPGLVAGVAGGSGAERAVSGEGHQREVDRVEVVLQVEDAREAGRGPWFVVPGTVSALAAKQVFDAAVDRRGRRGRR